MPVPVLAVGEGSKFSERTRCESPAAEVTLTSCRLPAVTRVPVATIAL